MNKLQEDNEEGLFVTVSVLRNGTGRDSRHFLGDYHLQNVGELKDIVTNAVDWMAERCDITSI